MDLSETKNPNRSPSLEEVTSWLEERGFADFAKRLSDVEFAGKIAEQKRECDYWYLNEHLWELKEDRLLQDLIVVQSSLFDKSSTYNTVIVSLGYAGLFTVWGHINSGLSVYQNAWVGGLLMISLLVFVVWTLLNSAAITHQIRRRAVALGSEFDSRQDLIEAHRTVDLKNNRTALRLQRNWPWVFFLTTFSGLGCGCLLLAFLAEDMIGFEWLGLASKLKLLVLGFLNNAGILK